MRTLYVFTVVALCTEFVRARDHHRRHPPEHSPPKTVTTYHMFQPKYTGLANKDAGDFRGEVAFIFSTFSPNLQGNPEANIAGNVFEMSRVTVSDWSDNYIRCNAPGSNWSYFEKCPITFKDYCCPNRTDNSRDSLPGWRFSRRPVGYWFSFPKESEGRTWTETVERRIKSKCVADTWRAEAGGCKECGEELNECVAQCIQKALAPETKEGSHERNYAKLEASWNRIFSDKTLCADQPFPQETLSI